MQQAQYLLHIITTCAVAAAIRVMANRRHPIFVRNPAQHLVMFVDVVVKTTTWKQCAAAKTERKKMTRAPQECDKALFDTLCSVYTENDNDDVSDIVLDNYVYDQLSGTSVDQKFEPQPFIELTIHTVSMRMHAANNQGIKILGAMAIRHASKDAQGNPVETS